MALEQSFMDDRLKIELEAIDRADDFEGMKAAQREHAISDAQMRSDIKEFMQIMKPISQAFERAGVFRKNVMATAMFISLMAGAIWAIIQTYFSLKH